MDGNKAAIVEVNSETDFVAKNDFNAYVDAVAAPGTYNNSCGYRCISCRELGW